MWGAVTAPVNVFVIVCIKFIRSETIPQSHLGQSLSRLAVGLDELIFQAQ